MKICILSVCFFRHQEIKSSLESIYNSLYDTKNVDLCAVHLPTPNSDKVKNEIVSSLFENKYLIDYPKNHVSGGLLSATLETDIVKNSDYVAVTETDIRILNKGCIEKCCEVLEQNKEFGFVTPEYNIDDPYHEYAVKKAGWIWPSYPYKKNINITQNRGYQLLVWRTKDWIDFCNNVKSGTYITNSNKSYGIVDGNSFLWCINQRKTVGVLQDYFIIHNGWDVYKTPSVDQEYLDYKNKLISENNIWSENNTNGTETYEFKLYNYSKI
jgi:hypothetical protein